MPRPPRRQKTPQALIDLWRPHREKLRPTECDYRDGCWVIDPVGATGGAKSTKAPRCRICGGRIDGAINVKTERARWRNRYGEGVRRNDEPAR